MDSPWDIVDNVGFKIIWKYAAEMTVDLPRSKAIKTETQKLYGVMKWRLVELLTNVPKVSLTVDAWTTENSCGLLGITVNWVNNWRELCEHVLAISELVRKHNGENMSTIVLQASDDFGLRTKVGSINTDNASSNRQMISLLVKELKTVNDCFTVDRHVPCASHVLNIIVQAALKLLQTSVDIPPLRIADIYIVDDVHDIAYDVDIDDLDAMREATGDAIAHLRVLVSSI
ncbi:putative transcriptional regulator tpeD [Wolffia australiana]